MFRKFRVAGMYTRSALVPLGKTPRITSPKRISQVGLILSLAVLIEVLMWHNCLFEKRHMIRSRRHHFSFGFCPPVAGHSEVISNIESVTLSALTINNAH